MLNQSTKNELAAAVKLQKLLQKIESRKLSPPQKVALQELLAALSGNPIPDKDRDFTEDDLAFLQNVQVLRFSPDVFHALKTAMRTAIQSPRSGHPFLHEVYGPLFRNLLPSTATGKVMIYKVEVRLRYRLIYAYGGSIERPYFLRFNHRKDIYKHAGFGKCSS